MRPRLVTQFSSSLPKILFLAQSGSFSQKLAERLSKKGFDIQQINPFDLLTSPSLQRQLSQVNYYKIVWLFGWQLTNEPYQDMSAWLSQRLEPTLIISRLDTIPDLGQDDFLLSQKKWEKQVLALNYFDQNLPKTTLLIAQDVIVLDAPHLGLAYLCQNYHEQRLIDAHLDFRFISDSSFLSQVDSVIFAPYSGAKTIFQAAKIPHFKICDQLLAASAPTFHVSTRPQKPAVPEFTFIPQILAGFTSLDFLTPEFLGNFSRQLLAQPTTGLRPPQVVIVSAPKSKVAQKPPLVKNTPVLQQYRQPIASSFTALTVPACNLLHGVVVCARPVKKKILVPPLPIVGSPTKKIPVDQYLSLAQAKLNSSTIKITPVSTTSSIKPASGAVSPSIKASSSVTAKSSTRAQTKPPIKPKSRLARSKLLQQQVRPRQQIQPQTVKTKKTILSPFIIISPIILALCVVVTYFTFLTPVVETDSHQDTLARFFQTCTQTNCLGKTESRSLAALVNNDPARDQAASFVTSLNTFSLQNELLNKQLSRFYRTILQIEPGSATQEMQLVNQHLEKDLTDLNQVQLSLQQLQNSLPQAVALAGIDDFSQQLTQTKNQLLLWQKYQEFFDALIQQDQLDIVVLLLNNNHLLSQGGQLFAFTQVLLEQGQISSHNTLSISELAKNNAVSVDLDPLFTSSASSTLSGFQNLPAQETFTQLTDKTTKILKTAKNFIPDLSLSFNLNSYSQLAAVISSQDATVIYDQTIANLNSQSTTAQESTLITLFHNFYQQLKTVPDEKIPTLVFTFLEQIDEQEILFSSDQPSLNEMIQTLVLNGELGSHVCPTSLGGDVCFIDHFLQRTSLVSGDRLAEQTVAHFVELKTTQTLHTRTFSFVNHSDQTVTESLQFAFPENAKNINFTLSGKKQKVSVSQGFLVTIPAQQTVTASLEFSIARTINDKNFVYSFSEQKQSGSRQQSFNLTVKNSLPYSPKIIAPHATIDNNRINFITTQDQSFLGAIAF